MLCQLNNSTWFPSSAFRSHSAEVKEGQGLQALHNLPLLSTLELDFYHSCIEGKCKHKGHPGNPSLSLLNYPPGVFQRCSQSQSPAKIRVLPLSRALCPALGRLNQGSGNWVLPHVSTAMSSLSSDGEGSGLSRVPKDTYYRLTVLLYRSKGTFRLLLISSEAPDEMTRLS